MNDNSICTDESLWRVKPWTNRHRARDRVRRLGLDVSRDRGRRGPDAAAAADARRALRPGRCAPLRVVLWRGDVAAARLGRREWTAAAIVGGLLLLRRHGQHRVGRAAGRLGPDGAPRRDGPAVHGASRPHVLRCPSLARRSGRDRVRAVRRRTARRAERARRSRGRPPSFSEPRSPGRPARPRQGRPAPERAVPLGCYADAVRRRAPRSRRSRDGRGGTRPSGRDLGRLARGVPPFLVVFGSIVAFTAYRSGLRAASGVLVWTHTPLRGTPPSPSCSGGRSPARPSAAASSSPAPSSSPRSGCSSSPAAARSREPEPIPETVGPYLRRKEAQERPLPPPVPRLRRPPPHRTLSRVLPALR